MRPADQNQNPAGGQNQRGARESRGRVGDQRRADGQEEEAGGRVRRAEERHR